MKYISVKKPTGEEYIVLLPDFLKNSGRDKSRTMPYITGTILNSKLSRITHCNYISVHGHIGIYIDNDHRFVSKIIFSQSHGEYIKIIFRNNKIGFGYNKSDHPDKFYDIDDNLKELLKNQKFLYFPNTFFYVLHTFLLSTI